MRPARSAVLGLLLVVAALFACKKNRPLVLSTPSNQPAAPGEGGTSSHKQINTDTYSVECWGNNLDCVKEAASVCQKGYDVLATSEGAPSEAGAPLPAPPPAVVTDAAAPTDAAAAAPDAAVAPAVPPPSDAGAVPPDAAVRVEMVVKCKT